MDVFYAVTQSKGKTMTKEQITVPRATWDAVRGALNKCVGALATYTTPGTFGGRVPIDADVVNNAIQAIDAANSVPQSQMPTIECSYLESKDDVVTNATLVIGDKTHRMVGEAMYFEVKHKLESLARTVMADQTVIDLPRIQSGKPLYQLIMEENERWLKEDEV